jgi:hypothetical protein
MKMLANSAQVLTKTPRPPGVWLPVIERLDGPRFPVFQRKIRHTTAILRLLAREAIMRTGNRRHVPCNAKTNRKARRSCTVDSGSRIRHRCAIAVDSDSKCYRGQVVDYSSVGLGIDFSSRPDHLNCTRMFATQAFGCGSIRRTTQANFAYLRPPLLVPCSDNQSQ